MNAITKRLSTDHVELSEEQAETLATPSYDGHVIEVRLPRTDVPATLPTVIKALRKQHGKWLNLQNASPRLAFEIRRTSSDQLRFQFAVPTKDLERTLRGHLDTVMPGVEFRSGVSGLPVEAGDSLGGGLVTTGRDSWYPLQTTFDHSPTNLIASALHRDAMRDSRFVIQVLFTPTVTNPVSKWWRRTMTNQEVSYLTSEKEQLIGRRKATRRERRQANAIDEKSSEALWTVSIRIAVLDAGEFTSSRVSEVTNGYAVFEQEDFGQYLTTVPVRAYRQTHLVRFGRAVATRTFGGWHRKFQATSAELGALVSLPDKRQQNIRYATPR